MTELVDTTASPPESIPISNDRRDRFAQAFATGAPLVALVAAGWFAWGGTLPWSDISVALLLSLFTGLGVTVGFHRLFTHRSFKTTRVMRAVLAIAGSMAVQGSLIEWVATHRKHH